MTWLKMNYNDLHLLYIIITGILLKFYYKGNYNI